MHTVEAIEAQVMRCSLGVAAQPKRPLCPTPTQSASLCVQAFPGVTQLIAATDRAVMRACLGEVWDGRGPPGLGCGGEQGEAVCIEGEACSSRGGRGGDPSLLPYCLHQPVIPPTYITTSHTPASCSAASAVRHMQASSCSLTLTRRLSAVTIHRSACCMQVLE